MKKIILSLVFVLGLATITMGNANVSSINHTTIENTINPEDDCFDLAAMIFFELAWNGVPENEAHEAAQAFETLCNILT